MSPQFLLVFLQTRYCERLGPGLLAEPMNATSNLAFILAAIVAGTYLRAFQDLSRGLRRLPWSLAAIALASMLYHTFRSPVSFLLDFVTLSIYIVGSLFVVLHRLFAKTIQANLIGGAFLSVQILLLLSVPPTWLNGSIPHIVTLLLLATVMVLIANRYAGLARQIAPVIGLYALAICFRTVDLFFCRWLPVGTHFLWHLAGAGAGFFLIRFIALLEVASEDNLRQGFHPDQMC